MKLKKMNRKTRKMRIAMPATISSTMLAPERPVLSAAPVPLAPWANNAKQMDDMANGSLGVSIEIEFIGRRPPRFIQFDVGDVLGRFHLGNDRGGAADIDAADPGAGVDHHAF